MTNTDSGEVQASAWEVIKALEALGFEVVLLNEDVYSIPATRFGEVSDEDDFRFDWDEQETEDLRHDWDD